jgi:hypothetical protein
MLFSRVRVRIEPTYKWRENALPVFHLMRDAPDRVRAVAPGRVFWSVAWM